jgi:protein subunit release factor B
MVGLNRAGQKLSIEVEATSHPRYSTDRDVLETECTVEFVKASGPGGQHRNKRETGVRLAHLPSGIVVMATERRSQLQNLEVAFERLIIVLKARNHVPRTRRPSRPTYASVQRRLESKRIHSSHKTARQKPVAES